MVQSRNRKKNNGRELPSKPPASVKLKSSTPVEATTTSGVVTASMPTSWSPELHSALKALLSARLCSAIWGLINDCDETFNYWEPTHYLLYGDGFQTWEYAPQYALRSYFYLMLHAAFACLYNLVTVGNKMLVFFFIRCVLAVICSVCELFMYSAAVSVFGGAVGRVMLAFMIFSAGMFSAATAFLPSSFAMYGFAAAYAAWLHRRYQLSILFVAVAALLGWPFAALCGLPIAYDIVCRKKKVKLFVKWSVLSALVILIPMIQVDSSYFGQLVIAPLNIIKYNIFTPHGADLYGTEAPTFYLINGFLNFNIVFTLALLTLPIVYIAKSVGKSSGALQEPLWLTLSPLYLWLLVFTLQSHKEERFLFPVYPLICFAAAISVESLRQIVVSVFYKLRWREAMAISTYLPAILIVLSSAVSLSRIFGMYNAYHAPMEVFMELQKVNLPAPEYTELRLPKEHIRVCLGKEWHRYPSSFFLPDERWELSFLESDFKGQLPARYLKTENASSIRRPNFNDKNLEETDRYMPMDSCDFLIDLDSPHSSPLEPPYSSMTDTWHTIYSAPFLDTSRSSRLFRSFYLPYLTNKYCNYNQYNLLYNKIKNQRRLKFDST